MADDEKQDWAEDPGWRLDWRAMVPFVQLRYFRRPHGDALTTLRSVYTSFIASLFLYGLFLLSIPIPQRGRSWPWIVALLGIAAVGLGPARLFERPLDCSSDSALVQAYRTRFFLRIAFAESIALFAFVFCFVNGPKWIYYLGAGITLVRMAMYAPTRQALERDQEELAARGCDRSLVAALRRPGQG